VYKRGLGWCEEGLMGNSMALPLVHVEERVVYEVSTKIFRSCKQMMIANAKFRSG